MKAGEKNVFPRRTVESGDTHERAAASYVKEVYGDKMLGGTQVRYLSGVPFAKLGLPTGLPDLSYASVSETMQHRLYGGLVLPAIALAGLVAAAYRGGKEPVAATAGAHEPRARASAPVGGKLVGVFTSILGVFAAIAVFLLVRRFAYGLGAVTNINNGYTWGIWVVWDVVIATGFACGGFAMAFLVYILNKGEFHPLVRPALTASVFGYSLGAASVLIDLGRYWNFWHTLSPAYFNPTSVMFEVAACISLYILVLWMEWFPTFLEWLGRKGMQKAFNRILFFFIGLGVLLPSMHQSSLGSLLVVMGYQVHPLWQTQLLPVLFLLTAFCMGFAVVILEATLAAVGFGRDIFDDLNLLSKIGKIISAILFIYLGLRFGDLIWRDELPRLFDSGILSVMFWIEIALFAYPAISLSMSWRRRRLSKLFPAAASMLAGAVLYRIDAFLVATNTTRCGTTSHRLRRSWSRSASSRSRFWPTSTSSRSSPFCPASRLAASADSRRIRRPDRVYENHHRPHHAHRRPSAGRLRDQRRQGDEGVVLRANVARGRVDPSWPRPARRLGDHAAHLRRLHNGPRHRVRARGGECAEARSAAERAIYPQHDRGRARDP